MSINKGTPLWVWPGARALSIKPIRATALGPPTEMANFGAGLFVSVRYEEGRRPGGTDVLAMSHVAVVHETTTLALFGEPEPPDTGVSIDADAPAGWKYPPARLRAVADALRPFLAAGVEPLEAAVLALDADEAGTRVYLAALVDEV